ncbi:hypothetical protein NDU88_003106 [Pleurodeles waltl]|uniref:Uncharacterized protein n=1 Tax=Pleurodeles waltl TaxID=8319 RepID=A0AAV7PBD1_PLEWA|nr:hypothetical protein NDU88_003106 [Pleurodeles waltl]
MRFSLQSRHSCCFAPATLPAVLFPAVVAAAITFPSTLPAGTTTVATAWGGEVWRRWCRRQRPVKVVQPAAIKLRIRENLNNSKLVEALEAKKITPPNTGDVRLLSPIEISSTLDLELPTDSSPVCKSLRHSWTTLAQDQPVGLACMSFNSEPTEKVARQEESSKGEIRDNAEL